LSAVVTIGPHLNHHDRTKLLDLAEGKTQRELERLLAARFPKPDVADFIRKLPSKAPKLERGVLTAALPATGSVPIPTIVEHATVSELAPRTPDLPMSLSDASPNRAAMTQGMSPIEPTRRTASCDAATQLHTNSSDAARSSNATSFDARSGALGLGGGSRSTPQSFDAGRLEALSATSYAVKFTASERLYEDPRGPGSAQPHSAERRTCRPLRAGARSIDRRSEETAIRHTATAKLEYPEPQADDNDRHADCTNCRRHANYATGAGKAFSLRTGRGAARSGRARRTAMCLRRS
jgi:hypothetical protein